MKRAPQLKSAVQLTSNGKTAFSYRTLESTTSRRSPQTRTSHELVHLGRDKRERMSATVRDDRRSFTILAWMIRRHLDNVARFTPLVSTGAQAVDDAVSKLLRWHGTRLRFDSTGRHGRNEFMRMFEACKVIAGDAGALKVQGGKLQGIEGDRLAIPSGGAEFTAKDGTVFTEEGLALNDDGTRKAWCLCKRSGSKGSQLEYERTLPAADLIFDGYWPERFDANRGVSPLVTALNDVVDVRESWEWIVLKIKQSGLFGLAFTRTGSDPMQPELSEESEAADAPTTQTESYSTQLARAVQAKGLINLDMDPGDEAKEIESKTPYPAAVEFTRELVRAILLAVDIPFSFYDSNASTFSSRIADRNEYEESCEWKREKNTNVLGEVYDWLLPIWATADMFGFGKALKAANMSVEEVSAAIRWMPAGKPWMDRAAEMTGHALALACGVTSIPRICAQYGEDAYAIAAEQQKFIDECGIPLLYAQGGQIAVQDMLKGQLNGPREESPAK
jgi:capsid protein